MNFAGLIQVANIILRPETLHLAVGNKISWDFGIVFFSRFSLRQIHRDKFSGNSRFLLNKNLSQKSILLPCERGDCCKHLDGVMVEYETNISDQPVLKLLPPFLVINTKNGINGISFVPGEFFI